MFVWMHCFGLGDGLLIHSLCRWRRRPEVHASSLSAIIAGDPSLCQRRMRGQNDHRMSPFCEDHLIAPTFYTRGPRSAMYWHSIHRSSLVQLALVSERRQEGCRTIQFCSYFPALSCLHPMDSDRMFASRSPSLLLDLLKFPFRVRTLLHNWTKMASQRIVHFCSAKIRRMEASAT